MAENRISSRYAKSLIDLGTEQGTLEDLNNDMISISEALTNREFKLFVKSPIISASKKMSVFKAVFGESLSKTTTLFFEILTRKSREIYLPDIAANFLKQYKRINHITEVKLTTATPLSTSGLEAIKRTLLESTVTDQKVEIETAVDPNIIGGFVIELEDKLYDASIAHKLEKVKKQFLNN